MRLMGAEMESSEILINQLFAGRYLSEGDNIGHEVINLFEDDGGARYLYVTPSGLIKGHDVESVIFVRNLHARTTAEVIAVGLGLHLVGEDEAAGILYGGVPVCRIFHGNTYHGGQDVFSGNVTFRAERVIVPAEGRRILITVDSGFDLAEWPGSVLLRTGKKVVIPQGMRSYFAQDSEPEAYAQLKELIGDGKLWIPAGDSGKLVADGSSGAQWPTFLEIIGKEDDELAFSNLLAYYFRYSRPTFGDFAEEVLGIEGIGADFSIVRESNHNVDIWIESNSHVVVIENKIRSGINGGVEGGSQLDKYRVAAEEYSHSCNKQAHLYAFVPDYSRIDFSRYDSDGAYNVVPYSTIFSFFVRHATMFIADRYFPEFLRGLERQSMTMSELNYRTMRSRFMKKIAQAQ